jgi:hypothetical protein
VVEAGGKLAIEPALTQRLLVDIEAGAGDALPLLAFTLEQLYLDYRQTGALRLVDYEKFGGIKGAIDAAVERALVRADADPLIPRDREARLALLRRGLEYERLSGSRFQALSWRAVWPRAFGPRNVTQ